MSTESTSLEALGSDLGEAIARTPEYRAFEEAKEAVENDEEVQQRIAEFEQQREEFVYATQIGQRTDGDYEAIQNAQRELHAMEPMAEYLEAQERMRERLEAINKAISEPLVVDFGGEAGGCCQD